MRKYLALLAIPVAALAVTSCSMVEPSPLPLPAMHDHADPADDCAPGEIIVSVDEPTPCDLVGGANTLTVTDVSPEWAADHGCTFDGDDAGVDCDF